MTDRPAEPTTEELIKTLRFDGNSWAQPLFNLAADRLASLTAAKEAAEKHGCTLSERLDNCLLKLLAAEKQCEELRRALEQIRDGYLGDQTAEAQFIWAQEVATIAVATTSPKEGT